MLTDNILKALVEREAQLALARAEIDALNETLWVVRADGYRKADPSYPSMTEEGVVAWNETRRWRRHQGVELEAQAIYDSLPDEWLKFEESRFVNFRGIAWTATSVQRVIERHDIFALGRREAVDVAVTRRLEITLVATAAPDSKGPPQRQAPPAMDLDQFLKILDAAESHTTAPVALTNGQMGMINHWAAEGALIDAYQGNAHMGVYRVPWRNLIHLGGGAFVANLDGVPPPTDAEGEK